MEAHITKVEHDISSGWYRISTDGDPNRMDTKIREKAEEAAKLKTSGALAYIEYSENPRTVDGRTYRNARYERAAEANGTASSGGIETVTEQPQTQRRRDPETEWRIMLQTGAKLAVSTLPHLAPDQRSFESQKQIAVAWAEFFVHARPGAAPQRGLDWEPSDDPGPDDRPSPRDEDIPF
jgi:hypothetical protein